LFVLLWQQVSRVPVLIWAGQELAAILDSRALGSLDVFEKFFFTALELPFC
jgi:hypothetical protein